MNTWEATTILIFHADITATRHFAELPGRRRPLRTRLQHAIHARIGLSRLLLFEGDDFFSAGNGRLRPPAARQRLRPFLPNDTVFQHGIFPVAHVDFTVARRFRLEFSGRRATPDVEPLLMPGELMIDARCCAH